MRNSIYVSGEGESSYGQTDASGTFTSQKTGDTVKREIDPEMTVPRGSVYVVVGAEYAIHQETKKSFLYQALEQVASSAAGISIAQSER